MSKLNNLNDLFLEQLRDLHNAETQLVKALPDMVSAATAPDLKAAFSEHLDETMNHVARLEGIFNRLGHSPHGKTCKAMKGLIAEGHEMIRERGATAVKDAGLIAAAQRIEHYEIAGYGCVRTFAEVLNDTESAETLQSTLDEEEAVDSKLTLIASSLNFAAEYVNT